MTDAELLVAGTPVAPGTGWELTWVDRATGVASLRRGAVTAMVVIEGGPSAWTVTVQGRRLAVQAGGHRDRLLAASGTAGRRLHAPAEVRATLPGLVVQVSVSAGQLISEGDPLLTIEAMKMENQIRAPRAGRVAAVAVVPGQTVPAGAVLVRLDDDGP